MGGIWDAEVGNPDSVRLGLGHGDDLRRRQGADQVGHELEGPGH